MFLKEDICKSCTTADTGENALKVCKIFFERNHLVLKNSQLTIAFYETKYFQKYLFAVLEIHMLKLVVKNIIVKKVKGPEILMNKLLLVLDCLENLKQYIITIWWLSAKIVWESLWK